MVMDMAGVTRSILAAGHGVAKCVYVLMDALRSGPKAWL